MKKYACHYQILTKISYIDRNKIFFLANGIKDGTYADDMATITHDDTCGSTTARV